MINKLKPSNSQAAESVYGFLTSHRHVQKLTDSQFMAGIWLDVVGHEFSFSKGLTRLFGEIARDWQVPSFWQEFDQIPNSTFPVFGRS